MVETRKMLGRRIRSLRRARDLSQEDLAARADVSGKYLGEIERGQKKVSIDILEKISAALEVEIPELFDYEHEVARSALKKKINDLVGRAEEKELQTILRVLKSILE